MMDSTLPVDMARYLRRLEERIAGLERAARTPDLQEAEVLTIDGTTDWEELGGAGWDPLKVLKDGRIVDLAGVIKATTDPGSNQDILTLGFKYRPPQRLTMLLPSSDGEVRVDIFASGKIRVYDPDGTVDSLPLNLSWVTDN